MMNKIEKVDDPFNMNYRRILNDLNDGCEVLRDELRIFSELCKDLDSEIHGPMSIDNKAKIDLNKSRELLRILRKSDTLNAYWEYCSLRTYKKTFGMRYFEHMRIYVDSNLMEFCKNEKNEIEKSAILNPDTNSNQHYLFTPHKDLKLDVIDFLENDIYKMFELAYQKKIGYLEGEIDIGNTLSEMPKEPIEISLPEIDIDLTNTINLHPKIFEGNAFELFDYLTSQFKDTTTDISFIYHSMYNDKYIHAKATFFLDWLKDEYEIEKDQLKTLNNIGFMAKRQIIYTNAKDLYKSNKI